MFGLFVSALLSVFIPATSAWAGAGLALRLVFRRKGQAAFLLATYVIWVVAVVTLTAITYIVDNQPPLRQVPWVSIIQVCGELQIRMPFAAMSG